MLGKIRGASPLDKHVLDLICIASTPTSNSCERLDLCTFCAAILVVTKAHDPLRMLYYTCGNHLVRSVFSTVSCCNFIGYNLQFGHSFVRSYTSVSMSLANLIMEIKVALYLYR